MRRLLKKFGKSEDGNFAMITAISISALIGATGLGVNVAQLYHAKNNLRYALDAAVTSTARDLTTGRIAEKDARATVEAILQANSTGGFSVEDTFKLDDLVIDKTAKTLTVSASTDVDVAFPLFGMKKRHHVGSQSVALYSDRKIEVAMMLDVTGSMGERGTPNNGRRQTKLQNLQGAASNAVKDLLKRNKNASEPRLRVALVPYSQGVNTGALNEAVFYEGENTGSGKPLGLDDLALPVNKVLKLAVSTAKALIGDNCATERKAVSDSGVVTLDASDEGPFARTVNRDKRLRTDKRPAEPLCPRSEIVPLTADEDRLLKEIDGFAATGTTAGHIGIQWTQYMLSPKWSDFLKTVPSAKDSAPAAYKDKRAKKIAILMTDGEFNTAYVGVKTAGNTSEGAAKSPQYSKSLCDQMKTNEIEIFTIGFMLDQDKAKQVLRDCASPDDGDVVHFYDASDGEELKRAFDAITANIERVRLTS